MTNTNKNKNAQTTHTNIAGLPPVLECRPHEPVEMDRASLE